MHISRKLNALALAAAVGASVVSVATVAAPAAAQTQCSSNHNLSHVAVRLNGVIANLAHDQYDYAGHKAAAMQALTNARGQLIAAGRVAVRAYGENPACFRDFEYSGAPGFAGDRGQGGSDLNLAGDRLWVRNLMNQLAGDDRDYDGHKAAAVRQMQIADGQLTAALAFAHHHGE